MWSAFIAGVWYQCRSIIEVARLLERDKDTRQMPALLRKAGADKDKSLLIAVSMT